MRNNGMNRAEHVGEKWPDVGEPLRAAEGDDEYGVKRLVHHGYLRPASLEGLTCEFYPCGRGRVAADTRLQPASHWPHDVGRLSQSVAGHRGTSKCSTPTALWRVSSSWRS